MGCRNETRLQEMKIFAGREPDPITATPFIGHTIANG